MSRPWAKVWSGQIRINFRPNLSKPLQFANLYHQADNALQAEACDGFKTLLGDHAVAVTGGVLRLDAEQETGHKCVHVDHARRPTRIVQVLRGQVTVRVRDQVPDAAERQPTEREAHAEHQQCPSPLRVHQRREQVLQVSPS